MQRPRPDNDARNSLGGVGRLMEAGRMLPVVVERSLKVLPAVELERGERVVIPIEATVPDSVVPRMDVLFLVDVSGSYADDLPTIRSKAPAILADLGSRGPDVRFGVAAFSDFPIAPWGDPWDVPYQLLQPVTDDPDRVPSALDDASPSTGTTFERVSSRRCFRRPRAGGETVPPTATSRISVTSDPRRRDGGRGRCA